MVAYTHSILNTWKNPTVGFWICMDLFVRGTQLKHQWRSLVPLSYQGDWKKNVKNINHNVIIKFQQKTSN